MVICKVSEGEVEAYSSCSVELVFAPEVAASHRGEFLLTFSHPSLKPVSIYVSHLLSCAFNLKSCIHTSKRYVLKCILGLPTTFICKNAQKFCAHVKQRMVVGNKGSGYF